MRDKESVRTALSAAETGHLVLATLHTVDAAETINRLLDFFPDGEQQQMRALIAGTLKGIISQRLVVTADGPARTAITEVLTMTNRVHEMIIDPKLTDQIPDVIKDGEYYGMQTFDQAFYAAVKRGAVDIEEALRHATSPHDLKLLDRRRRQDAHVDVRRAGRAAAQDLLERCQPDSRWDRDRGRLRGAQPLKRGLPSVNTRFCCSATTRSWRLGFARACRRTLELIRSVTVLARPPLMA